MKELKGKNIRALVRIISPANYLFIYLVILALFNILLLNLPLTNYLGYEFSVFNSALIILLSGIFTISLLKKNKDGIENKKVFKLFALAFLLFLVLPFLISLFSLFKTVACPLGDGIPFYLAITFPAPLIGIAIGLLSFSIWKRFAYLVFIAVLVLISGIPVLEIYFNPQIYFYNPIVGFFPGTIYDEGIEVDVKLISYRMMNFIFFSFLIWLLFKSLITKTKTSLIVTALYAVLVPVIFILLSPQLGFSTTHSEIKKELSNTLITTNCEIHYSTEINDSLIKVIALHHEFYFTELEKYFDDKPGEKIKSFIFKNREQKKRLFGTANADVAKPWMPEIYLSAGNYDKTLKHELAHCFAGVFGSKIFKVADNFNPVLIEGIASAADPEYDEIDLDYTAALAVKNDFKVDVNNLFESFNFFKQPSSLGYITAGSFIKYLVDKHGIDRFKNIYTDLSFEKYYGNSLDQLVQDYKIYLDEKFNITSGERHRANYYFGRKSIFYKVCPRYVAKKIASAWKLFDQKNVNDAKNIFEDLIHISDSYSPLMGLAYCYAEQDEYQKAIEILKKNITRFENTAYYYEIEFMLADLLAKTKQTAEAKKIYESIISQNPNRILFSLSALRMDLINSDSIIVNYFNGEASEKYEILKSLNLLEYNYNTFPYLASLSDDNKIEYENFLKIFSKTLEVENYLSAYAIYKLSLHMCEKMDFERARKMAALSLRYSNDVSFISVLKSNFEKMDWLYKNKDMISSFTVIKN